MSKYLPMCCNEVEMREAAAKICRNYLHGAWKSVASKDLIFQRISGGLSNFLYYVALPDKSILSTTAPSPIKDETEKLDEDMPYSDGDKKSTIRKLLGRSYNRQTSFIMEEPKNVLIRIYGQTQSERGVDNIIMDSVIFTLLSERRLGPRLHGVFSGGRIEEYIPARQLLTRELAEPSFSMKIAEKMAAIHSMDVPLCKEPEWLWKKIGKWLPVAIANLENYNDNDMNTLQIVNTIKKYCIENEVAWLKNFLSDIDSPVVFCHNDLQEGNILLKEDIPNQNDETNDDFNVDYSSINHDTSSDSFLSDSAKDNNSSAQNTTQRSGEIFRSIVSDGSILMPPTTRRKNSFNADDECNTTDSICSHISDESLANGEPKLVLIDYEYCAYNHRGFDLANHFLEWTYDYSNPDYPYYFEKLDQYPTLEQKEIFMKQYFMKIQGGEPPSVEEINHLNAEVEAYTLASHLFWSLWSIVNVTKSQIPFGYWNYALSRLDSYYRVKQDIIKKDPNNHSVKRKIREVDI